jgi:hypothetical protein
LRPPSTNQASEPSRQLFARSREAFLDGHHLFDSRPRELSRNRRKLHFRDAGPLSGNPHRFQIRSDVSSQGVSICPLNLEPLGACLKLPKLFSYALIRPCEPFLNCCLVCMGHISLPAQEGLIRRRSRLARAVGLGNDSLR